MGAVITNFDRYGFAAARLSVPLSRAFAHNAILELARLSDNNANAAPALDNVDRRRRSYMERLLLGAGVSEPLAATRAQLLNWTYLLPPEQA